jgi:uncharacterized protein
MSAEATHIAFAGARRLALGDLAEVTQVLREALAAGETATLLVFEIATGEQIDLDLRATPPPRRGPGRPKLGVVAREVTLLPRHWDWLNAQPGGASVALRKLVEDARKNPEARQRQRRDALYRFTSAMAGDAPGFEEAARALFAGDRLRFEANTAAWPTDVRSHALSLAEEAFE